MGHFCDIVYDISFENTARAALAASNSTTPYGTCPVPPQTVYVDEFAPGDAGDAIPPYMPGNERWKLDIWVLKDNEKLSGLRVYAILRDELKLFNSKW